ncbi:MAG: outer membrane protein assembly factor BamE [Paracoccaceae bacterium]|nr:outer membrane protein assembly factor BamE [Paracoccaceae bacterium]
MGARSIAVLVLAGLLVTGCVRLERSHGYVPTDSELANIEVGRDTRETVSSIIGAPGLDSLRTVNGWYYVKSDYETFLWQEPEEVRREVVAILYSDAGTVANIERFGLEEGRVITLSRRVTESNVTGVTFLSQLLGNLGNFRLQDFLDDE